MKIYLGSPIDTSVSADPGAHFVTLFEILKEAMGDTPFVAFNPMASYLINHMPGITEASCQYIFDLNTRALELADLSVFYLDDSPTVGVPIEIYLSATTKHQASFLLLNTTKPPGVVLRALTGLVIVHTREDLVKELKIHLAERNYHETY